MFPHHEDENPDLQDELEHKLRAVALRVFGEPQLLGWLLRGTVPEAMDYPPNILSGCVQKMGRGGSRDNVGIDTGEICRDLFDLAFVVTLPDKQDPFLFLIRLDDEEADDPDALMAKARADARQVVEAEKSDGEPIRKVYCLRLVMNPAESQRNTILRSEDGNDSEYEVCIRYFGDSSSIGR